MSAATPGRAVVVGGTGYVGAGICAQLYGHGYDVLALGRRTPDPRTPWRTGVLDLLDAEPETLRDIIGGHAPAVVVNAAGAVWGCTEEQMRQLNLDLVQRLLFALRRLPRPPRLVQLGSVHEYGVQPPATRLVESLPAQPNTPYGHTKLLATMEVLGAAADGRVPGVVLRVTNVIGVGAPRASLAGRVAGELAAAARAGTPAQLRLSPLHAERDFVDARDAADAVLRAVHAPGVVGQLINIGSGQPVPVRSLVQRLIQISGVPATVVETGEQEPTRSLHLDWQEADVRLAKELLGWQPQRSLDDSLRSLWGAVRP